MRKFHEIFQLGTKAGAQAASWSLGFLIVVAIVAVVATRNFSKSGGAHVDDKAIMQATKKCTADCRAIDHDEGCDAFCTCQVNALVARTDRSDLEREWSQKSADAFSPEFTKSVQRATAECGAELVDRRFMHSCVAGCGQATPACLETCECILENLRGKGDRTESTLKLVEQESQPAKPETEQRMREILNICRSAHSHDVSEQAQP